MRLIELGVIGKPHGYRGEFVALTDTGQASALETASELYVGENAEVAQPYKVLSSTWMPKGWKLKLAGIESEDLVKSLRGHSLFLNREELPPTEENEFYLGDLVGCAVNEEETGEEIGKFQAIENLPFSGTHDRWQIELKNGDTLTVPAIRRYVVKVDVPARLIWLRNLKDFE